MNVAMLGPVSDTPSSLARPLFASRVQAGFPSPAQDHIEQRLDLNTLCIEHPSATFFARAIGDSMLEAGIAPGDLLVIDRALEPRHGDIIVASLEGEFTVKELCLHPTPCLKPHNRHYAPLPLDHGSELDIFGVVTYTIHRTRRK